MAADFTVVFSLYPRVTQLDFTGPYEVFWRLPGAECVFASASGGKLQADGGITFANVQRLADTQKRYERVRRIRDAAVQRAEARLS